MCVTFFSRLILLSLLILPVVGVLGMGDDCIVVVSQVWAYAGDGDSHGGDDGNTTDSGTGHGNGDGSTGGQESDGDTEGGDHGSGPADSGDTSGGDAGDSDGNTGGGDPSN